MTLTLFGYDPTVTVSTLGGTFTRADATTCATYVDKNGVVQTVAANVLRDNHYVNGFRTTLLEGSRQNLGLRSGDVSNAQWGKGNVTVGAAATDPSGGSSAYNIYPTTTGANRSVFNTCTMTVAAWTVSVYAKANGLNWLALGKVDGTNTGVQWFNVATGALGTGPLASHTSGITSIGNGWYRCWIQTTAAAATQYLNCFVCDADNSLTATTSGTNGILFWGGQMELGAFPSSYIATGASAVTRAADALSFPFLPVPQASTFFFSGYDLMAGANLYAMGVAKSDGSAPQINIQGNGSAKYLVTTNNGSANVSSTPNQTVAFGDGIEFRGVLNADGSVLGGISDNSAAEVLGSTSGANTLAAQWGGVSNPVLGVAQLGNAGSSVGFVAVRKIVIASGVQSLNTMRTLSATGSGATVTNTLSAASLMAEVGWNGQPAYTVLDTGTATALQASAIPTNTNQQVRVLRLDVTCSAAPAAGTIVTIQDGTTVLWYGTLSTGQRKLSLDFTRKPLRGSRGATVTAEMASAGGSVVQTIVMTCDTVRAP